jgi:hypothetical protein
MFDVSKYGLFDVLNEDKRVCENHISSVFLFIDSGGLNV